MQIIVNIIQEQLLLMVQQGLKFNDCLDYAYNEIKDRKGKLINGTFVKESDL